MKPVKIKRRRPFLRFLGFMFTFGVILFVVGAGVAGYIVWKASEDLPDYETLANYEPDVLTRIHASDGRLIGEYGEQKRIFLPINAIPPRVIHAFIAVEDQHFYEHNGIDVWGILRAGSKFVENKISGSKKRPEGASTITQQVAKNLLLSTKDEKAPDTIERKIKEAILAVRIENAFSKNKILELYLNAILFGGQTYGIASASLRYFNKEVKDLTIEEAAYLAALPKKPNNLHPIEHKEEATKRRNYVIDRMADENYITRAEAEEAKKKPLGYNPRPSNASSQYAAEYFSEEVRRAVVGLYGDAKLMGGGLSVHSTLDPDLQQLARRALREGLIRYDRKQGYRGPVKKIKVAGDWGRALFEIQVLSDLAPWRLGVVLEVSKERAVVGLQPEKDNLGRMEKARSTVELSWSDVRWAKSDKDNKGKRAAGIQDVLAVGDVIYVAPPEDILKDDDEDKAKAENTNFWRLVQIPKIDGAIVVMDPHTGRVLAIAGGFSYADSQFDRAMQAKRQPGSTFKPIVYAAALDNGYSPSSIVLDAPLSIDQGPGKEAWTPKNYETQFYGPSTLRLGIEKSRNMMTARLAQDLGMPIVAEYARRFGVYENMPLLPAMALGAGETTLLQMTTGYCSFVNGGKRVQATMIDRIQDRYGKTIWRHDVVSCPDCKDEPWRGQDEPELKDERAQILDPFSAYQMTSILEGVVKRGTGIAIAKVGKPLAGKTGTSNDEKDAWFVGFSPDLAVGVFVGYDNPKPMGKGETGGHVAAPIFRDFMRWALANKPATPFRAPSGIKLVRIDAKTGMRAQPGTEKTILEAYKPNEEPSDPLSFVTSGVEGGGEGGASGSESATDPNTSLGQGYVRKPETGGLY